MLAVGREGRWRIICSRRGRRGDLRRINSKMGGKQRVGRGPIISATTATIKCLDPWHTKIHSQSFQNMGCLTFEVNWTSGCGITWSYVPSRRGIGVKFLAGGAVHHMRHRKILKNYSSIWQAGQGHVVGSNSRV